MNFILSSTGAGWREIEDEWDFPRAERWIDYCSVHPPLQMMIAAYLGFNKPKPIRVTKENFGAFMDQIGISNGRVLSG